MMKRMNHWEKSLPLAIHQPSPFRFYIRYSHVMNLQSSTCEETR